MHFKNMTNEYQRMFPGFEKTPKAVIAAIAISFAKRLSEDNDFQAQELILAEWRILKLNNIVPQKPPAL